MDRNNDILSSEKLRGFHPGAPEGYFQEFRSRAEAIPHSNHVNAGHRAASYAAIAATFIMMVVGGTFFLEKVTPQEAIHSDTLSETDYIIYSTILPSLDEYEMYEQAISIEEIDTEDIVAYLIYSGESIERLASYNEQ